MGHPSALYLKADIRANLEVTLTQTMSVSQLKYTSALGLSQASLNLLIEVASNLVAFRSTKEQATESPLMPTLLQFCQKKTMD